MVELASRPGACVAQVARENGINDNVIFKWLRLWQDEGRISRRLPATVESSSPLMLPDEAGMRLSQSLIRYGKLNVTVNVPSYLPASTRSFTGDRVSCLFASAVNLFPLAVAPFIVYRRTFVPFVRTG